MNNDKKRKDAAVIIQCMYRVKAARKKTFKKILSRYKRVYDDVEKRYYYFNSVTGKSSWIKPKLLRSIEVPLTPRSLKAEQQRKYLEFKKERDKPVEKPVVDKTDKMGPPPRVVAKSWTKRAAVYWLHPPVHLAPKPIAGYKVKRWRLDAGIWAAKNVDYCPPNLTERESRLVCNELTDLLTYKFEVIPYWTDDFKRETDGQSTYSNIVTPKPVLPIGWEAIIDESSNKVYYHNTVTKETVWEAPVIGPFVLPTKLEAQFTKEEILEHKKKFCEYDLDNSGALSMEEVVQLVSKLGLRMPKKDVMDLMENVDKDCSGEIEFHEYIQLMLDIRRGTAPTAFESMNSFRNQADQLGKWLAKELVTEWREALAIKEDVEKSDEEVLMILRQDTGSLGDWVQDYSLGEIYYYNKLTRESVYKVPDEVRYYLPQKIKRFFTGTELLKYRELFDEYDEDGSGAIGPTELKNMYEKLGENFSKERLRTILSKVDVNNDGELDFREFVGMMLMFKLGNPRIGLASIGIAAKNLALNIVSSPKAIIKETINDTMEGTKIIIERSGTYKNIAGDEHNPSLGSRIGMSVRNVFQSIQESWDQAKKEKEIQNRRKSRIEMERKKLQAGGGEDVQSKKPIIIKVKPES